MAKKYCSQRKFWGPEACRECSNAPWPECGNILKSRFPKFERALEAWSLSLSRKEDIGLYEKLRVTITDQLHDCHWDRVFILSGKLSEKFPETKAEKRQAEAFWKSLPEYPGPLPSAKGEVMATFFQKKS